MRGDTTPTHPGMIFLGPLPPGDWKLRVAPRWGGCIAYDASQRNFPRYVNARGSHELNALNPDAYEAFILYDSVCARGQLH